MSGRPKAAVIGRRRKRRGAALIDLHRLAHRHMLGERHARPLQTTALVNEAYLRLMKSERVRWQDRAHFYAVSSQLMRRILVDAARSPRSQALDPLSPVCGRLKD